MFERITPEEAGISSDRVREYLAALRRHDARMHSVLMMKGDKLFAEYYWAPFDKDFCHRMYSSTKSYVGVAIGLLEEEGKLSINDPIIKYFPEKLDTPLPEWLEKQTIRDMLTMSTVGGHKSWFANPDTDRTHLYFNGRERQRPSYTLWEYDSAGSQVLSSLVEKLSGMTLLDYLKEKVLNHLGTFKTAEILKTKNGDSWGDSALLCTSRDMMSFARFVMNYGVWEGKRLMTEEYLRTATSAVVANRVSAHRSVWNYGYGYQIWRCEHGFAFVGMGSQLTICVPEKDLIFVCTADMQGNGAANELISGRFADVIVENMQNEPLPADPAAEKRLAEEARDLKLFALQGEKDSPYKSRVDGVEYICEQNPMGISRFTLHFSEDGESGELHYTNAQGDKVLPFGINHNVFGKFPQLGYSNDFGGLRTTDGFMYNDAVSAAWIDDHKFLIEVQIIDRYFGNGGMLFAFKDGDVVVNMTRNAEDFMNEYIGQMMGHVKGE